MEVHSWLFSLYHISKVYAIFQTGAKNSELILDADNSSKYNLFRLF